MCLTPPLSTLVSDNPERHHAFDARVRIVVTRGTTTCNLECPSYASGNCQIYYKLDYTVSVYRILPSVIFGGKRAGLWSNTRRGFSLHDTNTPALNWIKYNRERVDFMSLYEFEEVPNYKEYYVQGITGDYKANATAVVVGNTDPGDFRITQFAKTHLINGTSYTAKIAPRITSLSGNTGSTGGGHLLEIRGNSFSPTCSDNVVTIDGETCIPKYCGFNFIKCVTNPKSTASDTTTQKVGAPGLKLQFYNLTNTWTPDASTLTETTTLTATEVVPSRHKDWYSGGYTEIYSGYMKVPISGTYELYSSHQDAFRLYVSTTSMDPSAKALNIDSGWWTHYGYFFRLDSQKSTSTLSLTKDDYIYLEGIHRDSGSNGDQFASLAAKISGYTASEVTGDDVKMSEIHKIVIATDTPVREEWWIKVNPVEALDSTSTAKDDPNYSPQRYHL